MVGEMGYDRYIEIGLGAALAIIFMIVPDPPKWVLYLGLAVALLLFFWGIIGAIRDRPRASPFKWLPAWKMNFEHSSLWPFHRLVRLDEATRIAANHIQGSLVAG